MADGRQRQQVGNPDEATQDCSSLAFARVLKLVSGAFSVQPAPYNPKTSGMGIWHMDRERVRIEKAVAEEFCESHSVTVCGDSLEESVVIVIRDAYGDVVTRGTRMTSRSELRRWSASDLRSWIRGSVVSL